MIADHTFNSAKVRAFFNWENPYLRAMFSGVLLCLANPPVEVSPLAFVALVPFFSVLGRGRLKVDLWTTFLFNLVLAAGTYSWVRIFHPLAWPAITLATAGAHLVFAVLVHYLCRYWPRARVFIVPAVWVLLEYVSAVSPVLSFPWGILAYTQYRSIDMIQIAELTGVYGISFVIAFFNCALTSKRFGHLLLGFMLIGGIVLYGKNVRPSPKVPDHPLRQPQDPLRVGVVQGGFDSALATTSEKLMRLEQMSQDLVSAQPQDLIIWTETVIPYYPRPGSQVGEWISGLARGLNSGILVGAIDLGPAGPDTPLDQIPLYNTAFFYDSSGQQMGRYRKMSLVPFGERFPFAEQSSWVRSLESAVDCSGFSPGSEYKVFTYKGLKFSVLICYEGIFPHMARRFTAEGADFLINITNDFWSQNIDSHKQHYSKLNIRAVENRVYLVRAGNTGISTVINPWGEEVPGTTTLALTRDARSSLVGRRRQTTFYTRYGDVFIYLIGLVLAAMGGFGAYLSFLDRQVKARMT